MRRLEKYLLGGIGKEGVVLSEKEEGLIEKLIRCLRLEGELQRVRGRQRKLGRQQLATILETQ